MHPCNAQEEAIHAKHVERFDCRRSNKRKGPRPAHRAPRERRIHIHVGTQLHADIHGICDDVNTTMVLQLLGHESRRRARGKADGVMFLHQRGRCMSNSLFLGCKTVLTHMEGGVETEGFVDSSASQHSAAMRAMNQTLRL